MTRYRLLASAVGLALVASVVSAESASASTLGTRELVNYDGSTDSRKMCLDAKYDATHSPWSNGDPIQLWTCNGGLQQKWTFSTTSGQYGTIKNGSGLCLDAVDDGSNENPSIPGDPVQLWGCNGGTQQEWLANVQFDDSTGTQFVTLINEWSGTNVLDARNDASWNPTEDQDPVQVYNPLTGSGTDGVGRPNQDWGIEDYSS